MSLESRYWWRKRGERWLRAIVWRLPRSVAMWSTIRVISHATTGRYADQVVPDLTAMEALERWSADGS